EVSLDRLEHVAFGAWCATDSGVVVVPGVDGLHDAQGGALPGGGPVVQAVEVVELVPLLLGRPACPPGQGLTTRTGDGHERGEEPVPLPVGDRGAGQGADLG